MVEGEGKGWHGDSKGHHDAAIKRTNAGIMDTPIKPADDEENEDYLLEDWQRIAKRELEKELGVKTKVSSDSYYEDLGGFALESIEGEANNGEREWVVFPDRDTAEQAAVARVRDDLEEEPGFEAGLAIVGIIATA